VIKERFLLQLVELSIKQHDGLLPKLPL